MPAPGDQHKTSWSNPFEEVRPRVSEWTAKEIATISSRLDKQLGPEYISSRAGPGGTKVHYLTAEKCITLANEVFGFNGWSSSIQNIQVDFADENPQTQRVSIGLSVIVRVTLRDGTYHEDIGYGSIENAKGKAMAFEKAKKEGTTDALKRTLRNFGNVLGNCIYDKDYVNQVTKLKAQPVKKFDQDNLHRHPDFAVVKADPVRTEPNRTGAVQKAPAGSVGGCKVEPMESFDDFLGELDEADFCVPGDGHPDEIMLAPLTNSNSTTNNNTNPGNTGGRPMQRSASPAARPVPARQPPHTPQPPQFHHAGMQGEARPPQDAPGGNPSEPVAFLSARCTLGGEAANAAAQQRQLFNPKAESPSIRRTPGIDHTTSKPLARTGQHVAPTSSQAAGAVAVHHQQGRAGAVVGLSLDQARKIGAPGSVGSPLANRGQYKPPTMKRNLPGSEGTRAPLLDIPANGNKHAGGGGSADVKRQRVA